MKTKLLIILSLALSINAYAVTATWNLNPTTDDWNTASNWTPNSVPNSASAIAVFDVSNLTSVVVGSEDTVDHITFNPGASSFTISVGPAFRSKLTLVGSGIVNNSGVTQNFANVSDSSGTFGEIDFLGGASAGDGTIFTNPPGGAKIYFFATSNAGTATFINQSGPSGGFISFFEDATAADATFTNEAATGSQGGHIIFNNNSSAGNATFTNEGASGVFQYGGTLTFVDNTTAANATVIARHGTAKGTGGTVAFFETSTADHATFTLEGALDLDSERGVLQFYDTSTAADALVTLEGGLQSTFDGGLVLFQASSSAGNSTLIAGNGPGKNSGGTITFTNESLGGTSRIELLGPGGVGNLEIDTHTLPGVTVGSIEGSGNVTLGARNLTVGTNNLSTVFSGTIVDGRLGSGGSLSKTGTATLTLSGANTYTGGTTVSQGAFLASNTNGSATGTGAVSVSSGTLGGSGIIAGPVTVGGATGAALAPAFGSNKQVTLTLQSSLTLQAGATYTYGFKARNSQTRSDLVVANGVTIAGATITLKGKTQGAVTPGTVLTVLSNTSANLISGTFSNLADGAIVNVNGNNFQASYTGGDGNDLTLTVVP